MAVNNNANPTPPHFSYFGTLYKSNTSYCPHKPAVLVTPTSLQIAFVAPPLDSMAQRRPHLGIQETIQQRDGESLRAQQQGACEIENVISDAVVGNDAVDAVVVAVVVDVVVGRSEQHHQIGDAQQWNQHEQRFGRLAVLLRFDGVGRTQLCDQHLLVVHMKNAREFRCIAVASHDTQTLTHMMRRRNMKLTTRQATAGALQIQSTSDSRIQAHSRPVCSTSEGPSS